MIERGLEPLQQFLLYAGFVVVVGCVAWLRVVAPRVAAGPEGAGALADIRGRVARLGALAAAGLLGVWVLRFVLQVVAFRDPFVPLSEDVSFLLFDILWGPVWMAQGAILILLVGAFAAIARAGRAGTGSRMAEWGAALLALGLVATLALSSHAMSAEKGRPVVVLADGVHALAAGTWIGTLAVILSAGRARGSGEGEALFVPQIQFFSPMAMVSVAALLFMGVALSWTHLGTLSNLWTTGYGRILAAKVGLAVLVLLAGFRNWRRNLPAAGTVGGREELRRGASWEVALASGVLLLTAVLTHSVKP